jgi:STE24 endopeptidase
MIAFLQYLVALVISSDGVSAPGMPAGRPDWGAITVAIAGFGVVWSTVGIVWSRRVAPHAESVVARFLTALDMGRICALATFWFVSQNALAREWPADLGIGDWIFVPHLIRLAPFALLLALLRAGLHPVGARIEMEPPSVLRTIGLEFQQALLPLGPLLPLLVVWDLVFLAEPGTWLGAVRELIRRLPVAQGLLTLALLLGAILAMPFLLRALWRARPMPPSALRSRLDAYAARIGLRTRDILVWPTGPGVMNAAVVGAFPRFRYVFVTDGLLEALGPDEVEAVFAHEAGHARRGHVLLFFGFTVVLVLFSLLPDLIGPFAPTFLSALPSFVRAALEALGRVGGAFSELPALVRSILMVAIWIGVVFGWISRRFEQEADVYGIDTIPFDPTPDGARQHPFARALEGIARETGGIREITGWRHFSIADRVEFVEAYLADERVRRRYRLSIRLLRGSLLALIGGFALLAGLRLPAELEAAPAIWSAARDPTSVMLQSLQNGIAPIPGAVRARSLLSAAQAAEQAGRPESGLRWLRQAAAFAPDDPHVLAAYARALSAAGRPLGARLVWTDLAALEKAPEVLRDQAAAALARTAEPGD